MMPLKRVGLRNFQNYPDRAVKYAGQPVRIWSGEHGCYWRPNSQGYTRERADAGRYVFQDALLETRHCDPSKRISFEFIQPGDTGEQARPESEWHEDFGSVLWWFFPMTEAPWVGGPTDANWPGYHTHWTPLPPLPYAPPRRARASA